jgi:hypothetical protein
MGVITVARRVQIIVFVAVACFAFFLVASAASAHVPQFDPGGTSLETATPIDQPATSWVYYGTIGAGEGRYYRLELSAGERLYVQLLTPRKSPFPGLAMIVEPGPGVPTENIEPDAAEYEPFTPGAYWYPATVDTTVSQNGIYYVSVWGEDYTGPYAIAVGYDERYTLAAWIRLPADLLTIYAWDGGWLSALWPGIAVLIIGGALLMWRARAGRTRRGLSSRLALVAGIFYLTTSATVLFQMLRAAGRSGFDPGMVITVFFIIGPAVLAILLLWLGRRTSSAPGIGTRAAMLFLGLVGFALLAGYFIGPVLAIAAAVAPPYRRGKLSEPATA